LVGGFSDAPRWKPFPSGVANHASYPARISQIQNKIERGKVNTK
jgi:hypothetical protein